MKTPVSPFTEQRVETRVTGHTEGRMEAPKAIFAQSGPIVIEELSACGLRLRSQVQLHPNEELVIHIKGEAQPIHTSVVWVQEGPPQHFGGRKTWVAGCQLHADSIAKIRLAPEVKTARLRGLGRKALLIGGILLAAALAIYLFLQFASFLGSAGGLP